jgi:hypothetical protein
MHEIKKRMHEIWTNDAWNQGIKRMKFLLVGLISCKWGDMKFEKFHAIAWNLSHSRTNHGLFSGNLNFSMKFDTRGKNGVIPVCKNFMLRHEIQRHEIRKNFIGSRLQCRWVTLWHFLNFYTYVANVPCATYAPEISCTIAFCGHHFGSTKRPLSLNNHSNTFFSINRTQ